jgi:hypothetical protein
MANEKETKNSQAKIKANRRYDEKTYDHLNIIIPKGHKDVIKEHAQRKGESVSAYVNRAIDTQMKQEDEQE